MSYKLLIRERGHSWAGRAPVATVHPTLAAAEAELPDYVRRNWDSEIGTQQPDVPADVIAEYFADALDSYEIHENGEAQ